MIKKTPFNTNNAWGFGGSVGNEFIFPNKERLIVARRCYLHLPSQSYVTFCNADGTIVFDHNGILTRQDRETIKETTGYDYES